MEVKIIAKGNEEKQFNELVAYLNKCGLDVIRRAGWNMPNYSGYFASLKGKYSERQSSIEVSKQHNSKALHISDVRRSCFNEVYRTFIENRDNLVFFETWLIENS